MNSQPKWRQVYDAVDRELTPKVTEVVRSDAFNIATGQVVRVRKLLGRSVNGVTAKVWNLANLPAGTDVARLRKQVGSLDREVRRLTVALERERRDRDDPRPSSDDVAER